MEERIEVSNRTHLGKEFRILLSCTISEYISTVDVNYDDVDISQRIIFFLI